MMFNESFIRTALGLDLPKPNPGFGKTPGLLLSDVLLIIGLALALLVVLALAVYLYMKFVRKRRRHVSGGEKVYRGTGAPPQGQEEEAAEESDETNQHDHHHHQHHHGRRYKYRVRRRSHRSRNPTLAETGGLPPVKNQQGTQPL